MKRVARVAVLACLLAVVAPGAASAAAKMWIGFNDAAAFRWRLDRANNLALAANAHATLAFVPVNWGQVAPQRPASPGNPFDPAYQFTDLDEFVRGAQARGLEPMIQIWGTPRWANGGKGANRLPTRLSDLTAFTRALAGRYSGRYAGYPFVRFWSIWNEPNLNQWLAPQFDSRGRSVGPALYARLYAAAYAGIKAGNPRAQVAIGETSARGRDRHVRGVQDTHSPGRFLQLVAKANPRLKFDAVAHHPYPTDPRQRPEQVVRWPNVALRSLPRFDSSLKTWFHRKSVPIWITEYGHETTPDPRGVSYATQSDYLRRAIGIARGYSFVTMFVWFVLHDDPGDPWQSGLVAENGTLKPAFHTFADLVYQLDMRNGVYTVAAGRANPSVRVSAREIANYVAPGSTVGVDERVILGDSVIAHAQPAVQLGVDGWVTIPVLFTPERGRIYYVPVEISDVNGNRISRLLTLVGR